MKQVLLLGLLATACFSLAIREHTEEVVLQDGQAPEDEAIVGAYKKVELSKIDKEIDAYIRAELPGLEGADLVAAEHQVVSGMNYKYTYKLDGRETTVVLWDQPWTNTRQITSISRVELATNEQGQTVRKTTTTQVETRPFEEVASGMFD